MFQNPINQTYTGLDATLEIVIMLLGAFLLGYWFKSFIHGVCDSDEQCRHACAHPERCKTCEHCNNTSPHHVVKSVPQAFVAPVSHGAVKQAQKKDDLKVIEGIGPKVEELLNANGVQSFAELETLSYVKLSQILRQENGKFQMLLASANTWAKQAGLAKSGNMDALKQYQDTLNAGRS